jgi:hypothetical protein
MASTEGELGSKDLQPTASWPNPQQQVRTTGGPFAGGATGGSGREGGLGTGQAGTAFLGGAVGGSGREGGLRADGLQPMPVSAVAAGRVPDRSSTLPTGADIVMDALAEEDVAQQAALFLRQQPGWRQT